jgi:hypothetical protein
MRPRVLWIEDSARFELRNLTGPVYHGGRYEFQQAENVTTGVNFIRTKPYDALIVDIRLPPGPDSHWRKIYGDANLSGGSDKLGLKLLYWLLSKDGSYLPPPPGWIQVSRIGVFTVESLFEISGNLADLGIDVFCQKTAGLPDTALRDMIDKLLLRN